MPSSLAEATTLESSRQLTSVIARGVAAEVVELAAGLTASQTTRPLLRSPEASRTPSGLNSMAVTQSVCFFSS